MPGEAEVFATAAAAHAAPNPSRPISPFAHTVCLTLPEHGEPAGLSVFAGKSGRVKRRYDAQSGRAVYLVGKAVHPSLASDSDLLRWCGQVADTDPAALRDLLGHFVILIDDRRRGTISFVSDVLGVRPWFAGTFQGRLVAGTDVLGICDAGLTRREVDYDAVSSWLSYNFDCTGGSVVRDYRRIAPGTVSTYDAAGQLLGERKYAAIKFTRNVLPPEEVVDALHASVSDAFDQLVRGVDEASLPLSGGFDSRLLCAMAVRSGRPRVHLTTVESSPDEAFIARRVAEALGVTRRIVLVGRGVADLFDDPLCFGPEGFPTARNLTNAAARLRPGVPVISGFMGDVLMRGAIHDSLRRFLELDDQGLDDDALTAAAHDRFLMRINRLDLLRDHIGPRAAERARRSLTSVVRLGRETGRSLAFTNIHLRHRVYFAGIFTSHLDVADALLPFYAWDLIDYNASHAGSFTGRTYDLLFQKYFPQLADVPHNTQVPPSSSNARTNGRRNAAVRPTRHLRGWASGLLREIAAKHRCTAIAPRKLLARLPSALLAERRFEVELTFLHKVHAFEERLRKANIQIDWSAI